ncbi:MAG: hypothetical protein LBS19_07305 [Clostridiales bacterium]|jgi:hypothetical protein|nr:hypothetical protein [Clostridiales bacterium]
MPGKPISTKMLAEKVRRATDLRGLIEAFAKEMHRDPLEVALRKLCVEKNTKPARVIKRADIELTYGHQLFNGKKANPSRDKVIQLAFGFGLSLNETQKLLKIARKSALDARIKRDVVFCYALEKSLTVAEVKSIINEMGLPALGRED